MNGYVSLWDIEQTRLGEEKRLQKIKQFVGRDYELPLRLVGKQIDIRGVSGVIQTLLTMGYSRNGTRGWVKKRNEKSRFHLYINIDQTFISIHTDLISNGKHRATKEYVDCEKARLIAKLKPKSSHSTSESLSREDILRAIETLKANNKRT